MAQKRRARIAKSEGKEAVLTISVSRVKSQSPLEKHFQSTEEEQFWTAAITSMWPLKDMRLNSSSSTNILFILAALLCVSAYELANFDPLGLCRNPLRSTYQSFSLWLWSLSNF
jgi:hypothetical protein